MSADARQLADWIARSNDHAGTNFVLVDQKFARVHVFDDRARLIGSSPVLLGGNPGDDSVPGIGARPIAQVLPEERTTPAGRFIAERGRNARGEDVVWVSYQDALSMHRVLTTNADEHRLERLATPTPDDNRISYGCINVPVEFYENSIRPAFATHRAAVYILPEVKSLEDVFGISSGLNTSRSNLPAWIDSGSDPISRLTGRLRAQLAPRLSHRFGQLDKHSAFSKCENALVSSSS